jgi:hypothetical protein
MIAAYVLTAAILLGYVWSVWRRAQRVMRER